jgi:PadR family transcriptional regulator, regulatory protein PadR
VKRTGASLASGAAGYLGFHYIRWMSSRAMTEPAFFILTALLDAPRHGYGIVAEVAELSQGRVQLKIGSLYGVLDRLVGDGLVELDREEAWQGRLRRYYRLTERGRHALDAEAQRLAANARLASTRLRERRNPIAGTPS